MAKDEESPFADDYERVLGTRTATKLQDKYVYWLDHYRNNYVNLTGYLMEGTRKAIGDELVDQLIDQNPASEAESFKKGVATLKRLVKAEGIVLLEGETPESRFLKDVKKYDPNIVDYQQYQLRVQQVEKAQAALRAKNAKREMMGTELVFGAFNVGAELGRDFGEFSAKVMRSLDKLGLSINMPQEEKVAYITMAFQVKKIVDGVRKYVAFDSAEKALERYAEVYDQWANNNRLSDGQRKALDPIEKAQRRIEQERQVYEAEKSKSPESIFDFN